MSGQEISHPNQDDVGYLYITQYRQLLPAKSAMHWGLYVAFTRDGTRGPGVLHHWNYSSNEAVTDAVIKCQGCLPIQNKYEKGYLIHPKSRGTRCERATLVSQYRVIKSRDLETHCGTIVERMRYHWKDENCQHFVQYVLRELKNNFIISPEEYTAAMREIIPSRFVPNQQNYAAASSSGPAGAPAPKAPSASRSKQSNHNRPKTGDNGGRQHRSGHDARSGRP